MSFQLLLEFKITCEPFGVKDNLEGAVGDNFFYVILPQSKETLLHKKITYYL